MAELRQSPPALFTANPESDHDIENQPDSVSWLMTFAAYRETYKRKNY